MRALIIDDSKGMRMILGLMLKEMGFEVLHAGNGREGLAHLARFKDTELVLVDWNMPIMDGLDFVCAVRANRDYDAMRVVVVTIENEVEQIVRALDAGADEYIMKPVTKEAVREKLNLLEIGCAYDGENSDSYRR